MKLKVGKRLTVVLLLCALLLGALIPTASAASGTVTTTARVNLRESASSKAKRLDYIPAGTSLSYSRKQTAEGVTWYYVKYGKLYGWVHGGYVKSGGSASSSSSSSKSGDTTTSTSKGSKYVTVKDGSRSMKIYPAESINWYTGGIADMISRGSTFQIYDVKTGRIWKAYRQAGGDHMDIEPATASDTKILCAIYGVSSASEIAEQNLWKRRPCLVTVNGHTYACSLYGIPHGKSTISGNNMSGQICLHFTGSKTHGTKKVDSGHKEAIQYALNHAPNGKK